jgi:predicted RNase H-like HicB family nuclease
MSLGPPRSIWDTLTPGTDILLTGIEQTMEALKYHIMLKKDPDEGVYIVSVPSLPGCHTFGKSIEEAIEMAKEAIEGYIESIDKFTIRT